MWPLHEPEILQPWRLYDAARYKAGLPWDNSLVEVAAHALRGAEPLLERGAGVSAEVKQRLPRGVDAVLELVGTSTLIDSLACTAMRGRLCLAGFLGGLGPVDGFDPLSQMLSGVAVSFFASFHLGTPEFPVEAIPFQGIVERAEAGALRARPVRVFGFDEVPEAHALMERSAAGGKMVVRVE